MFKENALVSNHILKDLEDVMMPLPNNRRERYHQNNKLQMLKQESGRESGSGSQIQSSGHKNELATQGTTLSSQGQTNAVPKTQEVSDIHNNKS